MRGFGRLTLVSTLLFFPMTVGQAEEKPVAAESTDAPGDTPAAGEDAAMPAAGVDEAMPAAGVDEASETPPTGEPGDAVVAGDEAPQSVLAALLNDLSTDTIKAKVETYYDPSAVLEDPFGRYEQRDEITTHLKALLTGTKSVAFDVREEFQSGDETVALWTLSVSHPKISDDEPVVVEGVTHARFVNGKIVEQRDYYDVGGLVYENVTFIGSLVRWVKGKVMHE